MLRRLTHTAARPKLGFETLEPRDVPAVTLASIPSQPIPNDAPIYLPLTATTAPAGPVTYTATTSDPSVRAEVLTGGRSLRLDVSGFDADGNPFSGSMTIRLFEDVAPLATGRIIDLANDNYYDGKLFHRVINDFVIQGGSSDGFGRSGSGRPELPDEFDAAYTFASPGLVAMANAGDDGNDAQFFITDTDIPLQKDASDRQRPLHLNFNHTIVGQLTSGFDTFQKIINTDVTATRPDKNVTINDAVVFSDTTNGVLRIKAQPGATAAVNVTVNGSDGSGADGTTAFGVTPIDVGNNSRAFLGHPPTLTTVEGVPLSFTIPGIDVDSDSRTFAIRGAGFSGNPVGLTVESFDPATGSVRVSTPAGFTGPVTFTVGVRDQTDRTGAGIDSPDNFDTDTYTLTVNPAATLTVNLTAAPNPATTTQTVTLTAVVSGQDPVRGRVVFFADDVAIGDIVVQNGQATATATFPTAGTRSVVAKYIPDGRTDAVATSAPVSVAVTGGTTVPPVPPSVPSGPVTVQNVVPGDEPRLSLRNADGTERVSILAFDPGFRGGVRTAVADVTGDGVEDVVAVPAEGGGPIVRVFSSVTGDELFHLTVFEETFRGGLYLAAGDIRGLGYAQILLGAGSGGAPRVILLDAKANERLLDFFAFDPTARVGATVNFGDVVVGGRPELLIGASAGGGPVAVVVDSTTGTELGRTFAGSPFDRQGIFVQLGPVSPLLNRPTLVVTRINTNPAVQRVIDPSRFLQQPGS